MEAAKLHKKTNTGSRGAAYTAKIYKLEKEVRSKGLSPDEFATKRKEKGRQKQISVSHMPI